jgi:HPt (histidine-containing phosphotransfer) domain-containing protein
MYTVTLAHVPSRLEKVTSMAPPIDVEVLFSRCMGNVAFALALLNELEANGTPQVDSIVLHASCDDPEAAAEAAHSFKGAAATIGAVLLRDIADSIETAGLAGETSSMLDMVQDLRVELNRCLSYLPSLRSDLPLRLSPTMAGSGKIEP